MNKPFRLGDDALTSAALVGLAKHPDPAVVVAPSARERLAQYRGVVEAALSSGKTYYGVNTGFGFLADVRISPEKLIDLQVNIIRSHACGVGEPIADELVRGLLLLRAHTFYLGHTGTTDRCLETILAFLKHDVLPIIPCQGSVGASGDLAPLAHLALGLMGEGDVRYRGERRPAAEVLASLGIQPLAPSAKEGLSLINGTHFMATIGAFAIEEAGILARSADAIAALSLDAIRGTTAAFDERIHAVRPQKGQAIVAANVRALFATDDPIRESHANCAKVQDPYSFRCVPQVHGASRDVLEYVRDKINIELSSVTDNPLCFDDGTVLSGGNFHGQPVAMAMDFLAIAMAEFGSISERRTEKLTNPAMSGLPPFITKESGLNSGYMIPHVVVAALVSENKVLCHPASVDSIPTSADKEDHVSMGPIAARKAREVIRNVSRIFAVELLAACQGIDCLAPLKPNRALSAVYEGVRRISPSMERDRALHADIEAVSQWLSSGGVLAALQDAGVTVN